MTSPSAVLGVIPARFGSTRFPGKPLAPLRGRPLIAWVYAAARRAVSLTELLVATDHPGIARAVEQEGGRAVLTPAECATGTERVAWVARDHPAPLVVDIQGDEPLLDPSVIDRTVAALQVDGRAGMATAARPLRSREEYGSPDVVKVVRARDGRALYFSRSPIPFDRDPSGPLREGTLALVHIGLYAFRREVLLALASTAPSPLEQAEGLEQLRALEAGITCLVEVVEQEGPGVDTPADLARVEAILAQRETSRGMENRP